MDKMDNIDPCCKRVDPMEFTEVKIWVEHFTMLFEHLAKDLKLGPEDETAILDAVIKMAEQRRLDVINECLDAAAQAEAEMLDLDLLDHSDDCDGCKCPSCPDCLE